jgi:transposase
LALAKRACDPSVSVAKLARENGLNANLLFKWRLKYQRGEFGGADNTPILLPVRIQAEAVRPDASPEECDIPCTPSQIEIDCGGFTVKLTGPVNGHDLDIVIDCLTSRRP